MVDFTPVDPSTIPSHRRGRRGRIAYPLVKSFMESGHKVVKLNTHDLNVKQMSLRASLTSYIRNHEMPIKIFSADGDLYMMRLDIDNDGNPDPEWQGAESTTQSKADVSTEDAPPIDAEEVSRRASEEKGQTTK